LMRFFFAVANNKPSIIRFLLEQGVNPNINDSFEDPILLRLAAFGRISLIELYRSKKGNMNVVDYNQSNALHWSIHHSY